MSLSIIGIEELLVDVWEIKIMERYEVKFLGIDKKKFERFVKELSKDTQAKLARKVEGLQKFGPNLPMPLARKIGGGLCELRIRGRQEVRVLYAIRESKIWFLNWFVKKSNKIPRNELELARRKYSNIADMLYWFNE